MYDVPLRTPEQAAKTAERHNKKLAQRFPLLADQLDTVGAWTPEHDEFATQRSIGWAAVLLNKVTKGKYHGSW